MESASDKTRAFVYALLVHLACIGFMFFGMFWTQAERAPVLAGPVIEATLVGPTAAPKPHAVRTKPLQPAPVEPPPPEPPKPPDPKPEPPPEPQRNDNIERERIAEIAQEKADEAKRAEEERHRKEQVKLEDVQKREAAERDRLKQLEDIRRQREAAEKKRKLEADKLQQLQDAQNTKPVRNAAANVPEAPAATTGANGNDTSKQAEYYAAIQKAVTDNWQRADSVQPGLRCMLHIVQIPGGDVLSVDILNPCTADAVTRNALEQAVKRAAPLPYKGYEKEFKREIRFNFSYDG